MKIKVVTFFVFLLFVTKGGETAYANQPTPLPQMTVRVGFLGDDVGRVHLDVENNVAVGINYRDDNGVEFDDDEDKIKIFDLSSLSNPQVTSVIDADRIWRLSYPYLLLIDEVPDESDSLILFDISEMSEPVEIGRVPYSSVRPIDDMNQLYGYGYDVICSTSPCDDVSTIYEATMDIVVYDFSSLRDGFIQSSIEDTVSYQYLKTAIDLSYRPSSFLLVEGELLVTTTATQLLVYETDTNSPNLQLLSTLDLPTPDLCNGGVYYPGISYEARFRSATQLELTMSSVERGEFNWISCSASFRYVVDLADPTEPTVTYHPSPFTTRLLGSYFVEGQYMGQAYIRHVIEGTGVAYLPMLSR